MLSLHEMAVTSHSCFNYPPFGGGGQHFLHLGCTSKKTLLNWVPVFVWFCSKRSRCCHIYMCIHVTIPHVYSHYACIGEDVVVKKEEEEGIPLTKKLKQDPEPWDKHLCTGDYSSLFLIPSLSAVYQHILMCIRSRNWVSDIIISIHPVLWK